MPPRDHPPATPSSLAFANWCAASQSPSSRWGLLCGTRPAKQDCVPLPRSRPHRSPRARARGLREKTPPRDHPPATPSSLAFANWCAASQSPSSRWGLLCGTRRVEQDCDLPRGLARIEAPGREPGDCGKKCHPAITRPPPLQAWLLPTGAPRHSPPARAGGFYVAHARPNRIAFLSRGLARIEAPGREPGDCGKKRHPAITRPPPLQAWLLPTGALRHSPPARAGGFYVAHAGSNRIAISPAVSPA